MLLGRIESWVWARTSNRNGSITQLFVFSAIVEEAVEGFHRIPRLKIGMNVAANLSRYDPWPATNDDNAHPSSLPNSSLFLPPQTTAPTRCASKPCFLDSDSENYVADYVFDFWEHDDDDWIQMFFVVLVRENYLSSKMPEMVKSTESLQFDIHSHWMPPLVQRKQLGGYSLGSQPSSQPPFTNDTTPQAMWKRTYCHSTEVKGTMIPHLLVQLGRPCNPPWGRSCPMDALWIS